MRLLLDANILLDCLVLEASGRPRPGKAASGELLTRCDHEIRQGLVAWHTLPIVAYYFQKQRSAGDTGTMMDHLMTMLEIPAVGHAQAVSWRTFGLTDFEDALQAVCAFAGMADVIITRNLADFAGIAMPVMTPEAFLAAHP